MITIFQYVPRIHVMLVTEHRNFNTPMNDRKLSASKGVDNPFEIQILNSDRKPADLTDKTVKFTLSKVKAGNIYLEKELTAVNESKGIYSGLLTKTELEDVPQGLAQLAFFVEADNGLKTPLFKNVSSGYTVDIDVINGPYILPEDDVLDDYGNVTIPNNSVEDYGDITDQVEILDQQ